MLKRSFIVCSMIGILFLGTAVPAAATATAGLPAALSSLVDQLVPEGAVCSPSLALPSRSTELRADALFEPQLLASSCTAACRALYFSCLDDCDAAPFPGCYDHCRFDVLYPCYQSCFL